MIKFSSNIRRFETNTILLEQFYLTRAIFRQSIFNIFSNSKDRTLPCVMLNWAIINRSRGGGSVSAADAAAVDAPNCMAPVGLGRGCTWSFLASSSVYRHIFRFTLSRSHGIVTFSHGGQTDSFLGYPSLNLPSYLLEGFTRSPIARSVVFDDGVFSVCHNIG